MLGAVIGDIAGSRFEHDNIKSTVFELLNYRCKPTDDTVMSLAVAQAILDCRSGGETDLSAAAVKRMQEFGRLYPYAGYGGRFRRWLRAEMPEPYGSFGNGAAMRVSACAYAAESLDEAKDLSCAVTSVTHDHPEGIKGAEAVTVCIYMALHGSTKAEIRRVINEAYYPMDFTLNDIRDSYHFDVTCQGSVPQAIEAFLEAESFEQAIRLAISIGGDSDTIAAIAGSIAEAYFGIPTSLRNRVHAFLDSFMLAVINSFEREYGVMTETDSGNAPVMSVRFVQSAVYTGGTISEETERLESISEAVFGTEAPQLPPKPRRGGRKKKEAPKEEKPDTV